MTDIPGSSKATSANVPPSDDLHRAALAFFPQAHRLTSLGDDLLRIDDATGVWKLRRWRSGTAPERIRFVHAVLAAASAANLDFVPTVAELAEKPGERILSLDGRLYDTQSWLIGQPLAQLAQESGPSGEHVNLPLSVRPAAWQATIEAIARFHEATSPLAHTRNVPAMPLAGVGQAARRAWEQQRNQLRPIAPRVTPIQRWLRTGERALVAALEALDSAPELSRAVEVVGHNDLWPSHILWQRGGRDAGGESARLAGIVDFSEAAAGSPLVDLAHLVTHFGGWTAERAENAMGAYHDVRPLSPEERRLLPAVAALDLIAEAGWLLTIAYALPARREQAASSELRLGATALVDSLEVVTPVLLRGDAPLKPKRTQWIPRRLARPSSPRTERSRTDRGDKPGRPRRQRPDRNPNRDRNPA